MTQKTLKLALEALAVRFSEGWHEGIKIDASDIMLLNEAAQALAQPEQELVCVCGAVWEGQELVETPPQRTWVGLTDEERSELVTLHHGWNEYGQAIEAKLKDKNCVG